MTPAVADCRPLDGAVVEGLWAEECRVAYRHDCAYTRLHTKHTHTLLQEKCLVHSYSYNLQFISTEWCGKCELPWDGRDINRITKKYTLGHTQKPKLQ